MNRIALLVVLLVGCGTWDPGIEWDPGYAATHQDRALEEVRFVVESHYAVWIPEHAEDVRWTDTPCPDAPDRIAVVYKDKCYYGLTFGCVMYVAKPSTWGEICHTALLHEYGHCLRAMLGWRDVDHSDDEYWTLVHAQGQQYCE